MCIMKKGDPYFEEDEEGWDRESNYIYKNIMREKRLIKKKKISFSLSLTEVNTDQYTLSDDMRRSHVQIISMRLLAVGVSVPAVRL